MKKHVSINQANRPYGDIAISTIHGINRVKKYNGKDIFLDSGTEFVIELDNPTRLKYLAKIKLNGEYISNAGIVLRPGEKVQLERYIDVDKKFLFETYNVSKDRKDLVEKNGLVEIEFYKESFQMQYNYWVTWSTPYIYPTPIPKKDYPYSPWTVYSSNTSHGSCTARNLLNSVSCFNDSKLSDDSIETGRVEQGSRSNQEFCNTYGTFETYYSYKDEFKIYPASQRQTVIHQEIRSYCSNCGRRKRQGENFCPKCGTKL